MDVEEPVDEPLSVLLQRLGVEAADQVRIADVTEHFGRRAIGGVLFVFGLLNLFPWPPGGTTITGTPLLLVAAQVAWGVRRLRLPGVILRQGLDAGLYRRGLNRVLPWLRRVETVSRPRLGFVFGSVGDRLLGVTCTLLSLIIVLLGYLVVGLSAWVLVMVANIIVAGFQHAWTWAVAHLF